MEGNFNFPDGKPRDLLFSWLILKIIDLEARNRLLIDVFTQTVNDDVQSKALCKLLSDDSPLLAKYRDAFKENFNHYFVDYDTHFDDLLKNEFDNLFNH